MATPAERRALFYESGPDFYPLLVVDINEYLIENFSQLNLKQRKAIWTKCQTDEEFDYEPIHDQIDQWIIALYPDLVEYEDESDCEVEDSTDVSDDCAS
jgi:hypothetical protein